MSMDGEIFPTDYDTEEQTDLAIEWAEGYNAGYAQAEDELLPEIRELEMLIFGLEDLVKEILAKKN